MKSPGRTFGVGRCKTCRKPFVKTAPNQSHCEEDSFWKRSQGGRVLGKLYAVEGQLKAAADASGNQKIWTAAEYDQDFLESLIPR